MLVKQQKWLKEFKLTYILRCILFKERLKSDQELLSKAALTTFKNNSDNKLRDRSEIQNLKLSF
jgi:hypothetical protein